MVSTTSAQEIRKAFIKWNGWGPPTSEYQIGEYCKSNTYSETDSDYSFNILLGWMQERRDY